MLPSPLEHFTFVASPAIDYHLQDTYWIVSHLHFVLFMSRTDAVPDAYRRYLVNSLRESFDLPGTPIRLTLREKKNPYAKRR